MQHDRDVRFVPIADIVTIGNNQLVLLIERGMSAITRKPLLTAIANKASVQLFLSSSGPKVMALSSCK